MTTTRTTRRRHRREQQRRQTETVYVSPSDTVLIVSPTGTIVIAAGSDSPERDPPTAIIILGVICCLLLAIIIGMLVWFRRGMARGAWKRRSVVRPEGTTISVSRPPSPLLVARQLSDTARRSLTPLPSASPLSAKFPAKFLSASDEPKLGDVIEMVTRPTKSPRNLTIDANLPFKKDFRFGANAPWTAAFVDGGQKAVIQPPPRDAFRNNRAVSYPSESYFPKTPDSSYPLKSFSIDRSLPPSPKSSTHRRLHTLPELTSIVIVDTDNPLAEPAAAYVPSRPHSSLSMYPSSAGGGTPAGAYSTPAEFFPELPPSPPPSPATITSPSSGSRSRTSNSMSIPRPESRSTDSQRSGPGSGPRAPSPRPPTMSSSRPHTSSSVHLSLRSSLSGASTHYSSLFFAPFSSSPPQHETIAEAPGGDQHFI